ncbi:gluconate 2-dehydrogenase subunit 3 family protein [Bradyrhizobium guangdongense]|uniref:Gluconate 2-dehydrogenase subunit 3 family protein n=2 Tax=Bradyrhizobium guangdongense TaxID=1325090 RepID=A0ABX6UIY8_9BRAD|nr:gluconate 2-dehydrogenase subunit 3 family protein [Bradyrhizobium guangdongense]QAU40251.1 gluconate 2-dehydrogenase subunit 3 family protein [Bradyrhizobium guangdongense]QOZ61316.1 gluconate 2-dehydrogenase subunit 3 family protein [Bradyrhizobium guangdongense]
MQRSEQGGNSRLSRRHLLTAGLAAGSSLALPSGSSRADTISQQMPWAPGEADNPTPVSGGGYQYLTHDEVAWLDAAVSRLIPKDELGPGAEELGVTLFIDRQLAGAYGRAERWYMGGPWGKGTDTQGYQSRMTPAQLYRVGIKAVDAYCRSEFGGKPFAELDAEQQDEVLGALEHGKAKLQQIDAKTFFKQLLLNTQEGYFADPLYGGNKDMAAWKMIGFPGARYDYRDFVSKHGQPYPLPPVSIYGRSEWIRKG